MKNYKKITLLAVILLLIGNCNLFAFTDTIDVSEPAGTDSPTEADDNMRRIQAGFQEILNQYMYFPLTGTAITDSEAGEYRNILFHAPIVATPTVAADHGDLRIADVAAKPELHWTDEDEQEVQMTSVGKLGSATTDLLANIAIVSGTLDVVGNIDPTSYEATNGGFFDEDNMASDSATAVSSQQSIKAYVDGLTGTAGFIPNSYSFSTGLGQNSITFPNGLIVKFGSSNASPADATPISYTNAFPNAVICGQVTGINTTPISAVPHLKAITVTQITPEANSGAWAGWHWIAIGR